MGPWRWRDHTLDDGRTLRVREQLERDDLGRQVVPGEWSDGRIDGVPVPPDELAELQQRLR